MKRPEGFDKPPVQRQPARPEASTPAPKASRAAGVAVAEPPTREPDAPRDAADTVGDPSRPTEPRRSAGEGIARSARAGIRAAAKARRRFEKAEVRRFTAYLRRRRRNWLIAIGAVLGLVAVVAAVAFSPAMALRVIRVEGASRVPATSIVEALGDQLGTPLALLDSDAIHRTLEGFTLIQSYSTESHPPDTLVVRIVERDPIGAEKTATGYDLVDSAGVVISSSPEPPAGYPLLDSPSPVALAAAGEVVRALPADIRAQVVTVRAATRDDVTLGLSEGPQVVWGSADDSVLKAAVLARLMGASPGASQYDVSSPDAPTAR